MDKNNTVKTTPKIPKKISFGHIFMRCFLYLMPLPFFVLLFFGSLKEIIVFFIFYPLVIILPLTLILYLGQEPEEKNKVLTHPYPWEKTIPTLPWLGQKK